MHVAVLGHHLAEFAGGGGLQPQVQFELERTGDRGGGGQGLEPLQGACEPLGQARAQQQGADVGGHAPLDAGPQHLDRHLAPVVQHGRMGLGQRGGGDRRLEAGVEAAQRALQAGLYFGHRDRHGEGRQAVLQPAEVVGELGPEDVGAGGEQLAELDRGGSQRLERAAQPLAGPPTSRRAAGEGAQDGGGQPRRPRRQVDGLAREQRVVVGQHKARGHQAPDIGDGIEHQAAERKDAAVRTVRGISAAILPIADGEVAPKATEGPRGARKPRPPWLARLRRAPPPGLWPYSPTA